jgi:hypothetical protein
VTSLPDLQAAEARRVAERDRLLAQRADLQRQMRDLDARGHEVYLSEEADDTQRRERGNLKAQLLDVEHDLAANGRAAGGLQEAILTSRVRELHEAAVRSGRSLGRAKQIVTDRQKSLEEAERNCRELAAAAEEDARALAAAERDLEVVRQAGGDPDALERHRKQKVEAEAARERQRRETVRSIAQQYRGRTHLPPVDEVEPDGAGGFRSTHAIDPRLYADVEREHARLRAEDEAARDRLAAAAAEQEAAFAEGGRPEYYELETVRRPR